MNEILIFGLSIGFFSLSISVFILKKIVEEQKQSLVNLRNFFQKNQKQSEEKFSKKKTASKSRKFSKNLKIFFK